MPPGLPTSLGPLDLTAVPPWAYMVGQYALIVAGAIVATFGYRLFRVAMAGVGLLGGAVGGALLVGMAWPSATPELIGMIVGGLAGAVVMYLLWYVGVFALGAAIGAGIAAPVTALATLTGWPEMIILFGAAFVGGLVALLLNRAVIIIGTAFAGALPVVVIGAAILSFLEPLALKEQWLAAEESGELPVALVGHWALAVLAWVVLAVVAMAVQFMWAAKQDEHGLTRPAEHDDSRPEEQPALAERNDLTQSDGGNFGAKPEPVKQTADHSPIPRPETPADEND